MRSKLVFTAAATLVVGFAALALAQQRQEGQPGGRGGRGGGGPPGGGGGFMVSRMSLLNVTEVRKELDLVDEQVAAIEKIQEEIRAKYPNPFGGRGGGDGQRGKRGPGNDEAAARVTNQWYFVAQERQPGQQGRRGGGQPPSEEDRARFAQQRLEQAREEKARLSEVLLPEQMKRLTEIYIQQLGAAALQDEDIAKELGISDAQKAKLMEVRQANQETMGPQMRELFQLEEEARRAKFAELRRAGDAKLLAVLSSDQQKKFEEMKGKPFAMPEFGGRGGPGGPGGGRRPGGNDNSK